MLCTPFNCCVLPALAIALACIITLYIPLENQPIIDAIKDSNTTQLAQHINEALELQRKQCLYEYSKQHKAEIRDADDLIDLFDNHCKISINSIDCGSGRNVLHVAAQYSQSDIIDWLFSNYPALDVNAVKPNDLRQPIHIAAAYTNVSVVQQLHTYGADLSAKALNNWSPLLYAVLMSHSDILEYLIDNNVHINDRVDGGLNALQLAIIYSDERIGELLVQNNAHLMPDQKYYDDYQAIVRRIQAKQRQQQTSQTINLDPELDDL